METVKRKWVDALQGANPCRLLIKAQNRGILMNFYFSIFGIIIGVLLYCLIVLPIEKKKYRDECKRMGLIPWDMK